jgi:hypothetical protein
MDLANRVRELGYRIADLAARVLGAETRLTTAETDIAALEAVDITLDTRLDTAEADIVALEAADTALDGRLDTAEADIVALETFHGCRVYRTTSQSLTNNTITVVSFDTEEFDTDAYHDSGTNPSRLTIPTGLGGKYLLSGGGDFQASGVGIVALGFRINGDTADRLAWTAQPFTAGMDQGISISEIVSLAAGDYVELTAYQTSGGALNYANNVDGGVQNRNHLSIARLGP